MSLSINSRIDRCIPQIARFYAWPYTADPSDNLPRSLLSPRNIALVALSFLFSATEYPSRHSVTLISVESMAGVNGYPASGANALCAPPILGWSREDDIALGPIVDIPAAPASFIVRHALTRGQISVNDLAV